MGRKRKTKQKPQIKSSEPEPDEKRFRPRSPTFPPPEKMEKGKYFVGGYVDELDKYDNQLFKIYTRHTAANPISEKRYRPTSPTYPPPPLPEEKKKSSSQFASLGGYVDELDKYDNRLYQIYASHIGGAI